jgi:hypothetical protein
MDNCLTHRAERKFYTFLDPAQQDLFEPELHPGFLPLPKRWLVERTHAWNERTRRLIMHHDRTIEISTAWVWLAEVRLLLRRLATA